MLRNELASTTKSVIFLRFSRGIVDLFVQVYKIDGISPVKIALFARVMN